VWRAAAVAADIPALPPVDAAASRLRELAGIRSSHSHAVVRNRSRRLSRAGFDGDLESRTLYVLLNLASTAGVFAAACNARCGSWLSFGAPHDRAPIRGMGYGGEPTRANVWASVMA
jgi:hypothetical protein